MILKRSDAAKIALHFCGKACDTSNLLGSSTRVRYKVGSLRSPSEVPFSSSLLLCLQSIPTRILACVTALSVHRGCPKVLPASNLHAIQ